MSVAIEKMRKFIMTAIAWLRKTKASIANSISDRKIFAALNAIMYLGADLPEKGNFTNIMVTE